MNDDTPWMPPTPDSPRAGDDAFAPPIAGAVEPSPWSHDAVPAAPLVPPGGAAGEGAALPPPPVSPWSPLAEVPPLPAMPPIATPVDGPEPSEPVAPATIERGAPIVTGSTAPSRPRRSKLVVGGAVATVLAVGGAGVFAVSSFGGSDLGGAVTPEELGLDFLAAIENEDVLGAIDLLAPGERDVLRQPLVDLVAELTRLEVLTTEADLSDVLGIDIELASERAEPQPTNVDDITNVALSADATITFDGAKVPIGEMITDNLPADELAELRATTGTGEEPLDVTLTAIKEDGRWYFSAFHTLAELARQEAMPDAPIPAVGIGAEGADSPEAAVDQLLADVEALDVRGMIQALDPGEAAALQRYAPLFLDEAEAELAAAPLDWKITNRTVRIEGDGDSRTAFIDAIAIEGTADGTRFSLSYDGKCVTMDAEGESMHQCVGGVAPDSIDDVFADMPAVRHLFDTIGEAFADIEPAGLELRETDGQWFVSPTATFTEAMLKVLRALDRGELDAIVDAVPPAFEEFFGGLFGGFAYSLDDSLDDSFVVEETVEPAAADTLEDGALEESAGERDWYGCFDESDPDAAAACFEEFASSGAIDRSMIPAVLRYPECGYMRAWFGANSTLADDEFIAAATAAQPCFQALIDSGEIAAYDVPDEITHLECFEGRNWYAAWDDPDYSERVYACITDADKAE